MWSSMCSSKSFPHSMCPPLTASCNAVLWSSFLASTSARQSNQRRFACARTHALVRARGRGAGAGEGTRACTRCTGVAVEENGQHSFVPAAGSEVQGGALEVFLSVDVSLALYQQPAETEANSPSTRARTQRGGARSAVIRDARSRATYWHMATCPCVAAIISGVQPDASRSSTKIGSWLRSRISCGTAVARSRARSVRRDQRERAPGCTGARRAQGPNARGECARAHTAAPHVHFVRCLAVDELLRLGYVIAEGRDVQE